MNKNISKANDSHLIELNDLVTHEQGTKVIMVTILVTEQGVPMMLHGTNICNHCLGMILGELCLEIMIQNPKHYEADES